MWWNKNLANKALESLRRNAKISDDPNNPIYLAAKNVSDAIGQLLNATQIAENMPEDVIMNAKKIVNEASKLQTPTITSEKVF